MDLIRTLVSNLGVGEDQAKGGAGLLLSLAKDKLGGGDFSQIAGTIPGIDGILSAAPAQAGGGLMGALGGLAAGFGGKAGALGELAELAGGFSKLGLDADMVAKFAPVILQFVEQSGGETVRKLLAGVLAAR